MYSGIAKSRKRALTGGNWGLRPTERIGEALLKGNHIALKVPTEEIKLKSRGRALSLGDQKDPLLGPSALEG